jgi:hypothetical protein
LVVAVVQPEALASHTAVGAVWIVVAVVGSVWVPDVKVVEVAVTFHPAPDPVESPTSNANGAVTVLLVPSRVVVGNVIVAAGVLLINARLPALRVTEAAVEACETAGNPARPTTETGSRASNARCVRRRR